MGNRLCSRSGDKDGDVESQNTQSTTQATPAVADHATPGFLGTQGKVIRTATEEEDVAEKKSPSDDSSKKNESRLRRVACGVFYYKYIFVALQSVYMFLCAIAYFVAEYCYPEKSLFKGGNEGAKVLADAIYYVVVSFTTVGFGDITPNGDGVKVVTSIVVLVGVILMPMANIVVNEWFDALDDWILSKFTSRFCSTKSINQGEGPGNSDEGWTMAKFADYLDTANMARKISIRLAMAGVYALLCTGLGQLFLLIEHMNYVKSLYTAIMSQTSVGYGDLAFNSTAGRSVGSIWILLAAAVTSRFLDLLVQSQTHKCMKKMLQKDPTESELGAAGITPETSRAEYALWRLKGVNLIDNDLIDNIDAQRKRMESGHKT